MIFFLFLAKKQRYIPLLEKDTHKRIHQTDMLEVG